LSHVSLLSDHYNVMGGLGPLSKTVLLETIAVSLPFSVILSIGFNRVHE